MRSDPASSRVFQLSVYAYLGYLQESLLEALIKKLIRDAGLLPVAGEERHDQQCGVEAAGVW